jgi:hypothetical protein
MYYGAMAKDWIDIQNRATKDRKTRKARRK